MIVLGERLPRGLTPVAPPVLESNFDEPGPSVSETFQSGFWNQNDVWALQRGLTAPQFEPQPEFNPMDVIRGTRFEADYLHNFYDAQSEAETRWIMSRIEQDEKAQQTIASSGALGVLATIAAGAASPTTLIPIGGWVKLTLPWLRAGRAGRTGLAALEAGGVAAGAVGAQEAVLQAFSETRTAEESFWNIAGAAIVGGVLGPVVSGALKNPDIDRLAALLSTVPVTRAQEGAAFDGLASSVGAAATADARGGGQLASTLGVAEALRFQDPMLRTATSSIETARNLGRDLYELPMNLAENIEGVATSIGGSVETRMKLAGGPLAQGIQEMDRAFSRYFFGQERRLAPLKAELARLTGSGRNLMTYREFKEAVYDAWIDGDISPIPEVAAAAKALRARVFDPLADAAVDVRVPGFVKGQTDDAGYAPRVYNREAITANRSRFIDTLTQHMVARQRDLDLKVKGLEAKGEQVEDAVRKQVDLTDAEIRSIAEETTNTILGLSPLRVTMPQDIVAGPRGPLKERLLRIPTKLIRDFVERDPEVLARMYTRTMSADVELTRKFGSTDLKAELQKITDEMNALTRAKPEQTKRIQKEAEDRIRDLSAIRDRLRGTYALPANPDGLHYRVARVVRNLNYMRLLGGMTISAVTDIGRPIMVHGLTRAFGAAFAPFVGGLSHVKLSAKEVKLAGGALDMVLDTRAMALADIMDDYGRGSKFERGLQSLSSRFGLVSLMAPWNSTMKQWTGIIAQTRILQGVERIATDGKISRKEVEYLAAGGIDQNMAERIAKQFGDHGERNGATWWANTSEWTDRQAIESFRAALVRDVDRVIVTPGQDKPLWMSTELGKTLFQFKSFSIASTQRTLLSGLQQRDMATLNGMMMMLAMGALVYKLKTESGGYEVSDDPRKWAVEAFDRSGLAGWLFEANNLAEMATRGRVGMSAVTGEISSRYASRTQAEAFLGPTFGAALEVLRLTGAASAGDWTASDTHAFRKLLIAQNLFYVRGLFDAAETGANAAFGIPQRTN